MTLSTQCLDELKRLCEEATPGPWVLTCGEWIADRGGEEASQIVCEQPEEHCRSRANWPHNARFIALAREAVPALLAEIAELREVLKLYDDALTEAEAIFGGEYADRYGPMFELAMKARDAQSALKESERG